MSIPSCVKYIPGEAENTITLWTRQAIPVWHELQEQGIYRVKEEYIRIKNDTISDFYIGLYKRFTNIALKHITIDPVETPYPIWFCITDEEMLQPTQGTVIFKLEVPVDQVLLLNYDGWGYAVNYRYVPRNDDDELAHQRKLQLYGLDGDEKLFLTDKGNFYPMLKQEVLHSWDRMFTEINERTSVVATAWEIRKEWIKEAAIYENEC